MERKIGEIFEYNGEWYQCLKSKGACNGCIAFGKNYSFCRSFVECTGDTIFKKLEKVGKPYEFDGHIFQSYRTFEVPIFTENYATVREFGNNSKISIEIKQNKEDMEEQHSTENHSKEDEVATRIANKVGEYIRNQFERNIKMHDAKDDIPEFDRVVDECLFGKGKPNLKPFNLEQAKAGKPVCTRDGRKARIICFDLKNDEYPIVAVITNNGKEDELYKYDINGINGTIGILDLMMLPEKKEGWVNVYKDENNDDEHFTTKDKRESPRLQSWDESASMFFLILDISDYGISRNTSDRLAEIRTRPQRRQTGAQLCKFLTQNSR